MHRTKDNKLNMPLKCHFKSCQLGGLSPSLARIDIKSAMPKTGFTPSKNSFIVSWKRNGEASFHPECWKNVLKAAKERLTVSQNRKRKLPASESGNHMPITMIKCEKVEKYIFNKIFFLNCFKKFIHCSKHLNFCC